MNADDHNRARLEWLWVGTRFQSLALVAALFVCGCTVDPFDPVGKVCRADALCPSPYTCVFPPAAATESAAGEGEDAGEAPGPREGTCELLPCARVVCPAGEICVKDACYPKDCSEEPCGPEEVCTDGKCVARSCVGVECDPATGCALAACHPRECADQSCGADELCVQQACTDYRCVGVICPGEQSCVRGFCYGESCGGSSCGDGKLCVGTSCVDRSCVGVVCPGGLKCVGGLCKLCAPGQQEVNGACIVPAPNGASCQTGSQCDGGSCVDGRCCEAASCGACQRCNLPGNEGRCAAVDAGTVAAGCQGYVCSPVGTCRTSCDDDTECAPGRYCAVSQCAAKKTLGMTCGEDEECLSGNCVSSVCCNSACNGPCQTCVATGNEGTCVPLSPGTAVSACAPFVCAGDGGCHTTCGGGITCAPGANCVSSVCTGLKGNGGGCDAGTQCTSTFCADGVCCNGACGGACEQCNIAGKLGSCTALAAGAAGAPACTPYVCNGAAGACPTSCTSDTSCQNGYYCRAGSPSTCAVKKTLGTACTLPNECMSGICASGVCCSAACGGPCESCAMPGAAGSCTARDAGIACTSGGVTGQCVGLTCTATRTTAADLDSWISSITGVSGNWGNGQGDRLVVGATTYTTPPGLGLNRSLLQFPLAPLFQGVPNAQSITRAVLKLRTRGPSAGPTSCWSIGGNVKFFVEEVSSAFAENGNADDCTVGTGGVAEARWPGPPPVTANRASYVGAPTAGEWISIDVTAMVRAAYGKTTLRVRLVASDGVTYDERTEARKVAFNSRHTTSQPTIELTFAP